MKKPNRYKPKRPMPISMHSHHSELVRQIRSAQRQHAEAREASRKYAKALWALRAAGIKPAPGSALKENYGNARSRMASAKRLLAYAQAKYKRKHGRKWVLRRRDISTGRVTGDALPASMFEQYL